MTPAEAKDLLKYLTPEEREEVNKILAEDKTIWRPLPGPQMLAFDSKADIIGYGGAAGGGKTDLACGKALRSHLTTMILRRESTQLSGITDRLRAIIGNDEGYNGQKMVWRTKGPDGIARQIEFGSVPHQGDETKYQGRPHDFIVFDEAANFLERQVRFLLGWLRTTVEGQRCQALLTFNPPTSAEGQWIIPFFGPWLDKKHHRPAQPGELRWFATIDGKDAELDDGTPFEHKGELITPMSRTFIPSRVTDNPYLVGTGYMSTLQSLPEPLRSQMLYGDFNAGMEDDPYQVIPTSWVEIAMGRWHEPAVKPRMSSVGVDVARGGRDSTVIARRHGMWFDKPLEYKGENSNDGPKVAGLVIASVRDLAPVHIDVIGVGSSPYDFLKEARQNVYGVNVSEKASGSDKSGRLKFFNQRSELWWKMREALDPSANNGIVLPNDQRLKADLCAPTWKLSGSTVKVESRDEIVDRIGRSPDFGSAYILALMDSPRASDYIKSSRKHRGIDEYNPYV
jgi:hypothetical protein